VAAELIDTKKKKSGSSTDDLELTMIINAKHLGFTLEELNEFTVTDFVKLVDIYTGENKTRPRKANQEDINKFFG
jgi:hypothetical protein